MVKLVALVGQLSAKYSICFSITWHGFRFRAPIGAGFCFVTAIAVWTPVDVDTISRCNFPGDLAWGGTLVLTTQLLNFCFVKRINLIQFIIAFVVCKMFSLFFWTENT